MRVGGHSLRPDLGELRLAQLAILIGVEFGERRAVARLCLGDRLQLLILLDLGPGQLTILVCVRLAEFGIHLGDELAAG